jgi:predicted Holliday junction resolvase-like endonuclease
MTRQEMIAEIIQEYENEDLDDDIKEALQYFLDNFDETYEIDIKEIRDEAIKDCENELASKTDEELLAMLN